MNREDNPIEVLSVGASLMVAFSLILYICVDGILGNTHNRTSFILFLGFSVAISLLLLFKFLIIERARIQIESFALFAFLGIVMLSYFISGYGYAEADYEFRSFLAYAIPGSFCGLYCSTDSRIHELIKWLDILWLVVTAACFIFVLKQSSGIYIRFSEDGLNYQTCSYYCAFAFGINSLLLSESERYSEFRFGVFQSVVAKHLSIFLAFLQAITVVLTGGRGGLLLLIVYILLLIFRSLYDISAHPFAVLLLLLSVVCFIIGLVYVVGRSREGSLFAGLWRLSSFFSDSERSKLFESSIKLYAERPVFGFGFFGYIRHLFPYRYPHNLVLQLLMSCGTCGFVLLLAFLWCIVSKLILFIKRGSVLLVVGYLILYPAVFLQFSGSFLGSSVLFFCLFIVANYCGDNTVLR